MDLFRPVEIPSNLGYKYCLRVMDGYSRFVWTLFLKSKSKVSFLLQKLFTRMENQSHAKITNIISDNGSEFKNKKLNNLLQAKGITHLTTAPYTPQQNPFAERGNRTTVTKARCLLKDSGLGGTYWAEAVRTATYLENITPKRSLDLSTPFSKQFERTPTYCHLQPFVCLCYYLNNLIRGKFTDQGSEGIFLGYEEGHWAYQILDRRTGNIKITHHVKFIPNVFLGKLSNPSNMEADQLRLTTDLNQTLSTKLEEENSPQRNNLEIGSPLPPESNLEPDPMEDLTEVISSRTKPSSLLEQTTLNQTPIVLPKVEDPSNVMESQRRTKHSANTVSLLDEECPKNFLQAMKSDLHQHWEDAIQKELDNMEKHQFWFPATLTENTKPLSTTWVLKRKTDEDGNLTKFKACLCMQGFHQKEGIDYGDIFSPTGRLTSLRLLLTLYHLNGFTIELINVKCAFLNGRPDKNLYIHRPDGYTKHQPSKYFILDQSLYRLKQSPQFWHRELKNSLKSIGLCAAHTDPCLYYSTNQNKPIPLPRNCKSFRDLPTQEITHPFNYWRVIGLLQYLAQCTRPYQAYSTAFLSQYLENPKDLPFNASKHVLAYLSCTQHFDLCLGQNRLNHQKDQLLGFTDSDWGGGEGYKSFSTSIVHYYGTLGWRSRKQKVVSLSSAEAEYNAMTEGIQDLKWLKNLILESTNEHLRQTLFTNNQSAIAIASNHVYHHGTRHINFKLHFIRNLIEEEKLEINYLDTKNMISDSLTKNNPFNKSINHLKIIFGNKGLSSKAE
ncbi:hypothetical protein O181_013168 [Austropuccinia psidii MF-1]|uniref:Integrase catalytic domain-containing protein n=1 Tax=Austropuccinia psidii MF-1 TaxID=1389203 RepID=A0A9Q3GMV1_9BASI|nr:hypothetical protein [Austropuccinia psidii MF-1]